MMQRPNPTKIYHITHVRNLSSIIQSGFFFSDAELTKNSGPNVSVGMSDIKKRRLDLPVKCHPGDCVGEYVPFYFCNRSVMLYILHMGNHPGLTYHEGQKSIVHLELDVDRVIDEADKSGRRWAFTNCNAAAAYAEFRSSVDALGMIDWNAVSNHNFTDSQVKDAKQSEFLVKDSVPWEWVEGIGVHSEAVREQVAHAIGAAKHCPQIEIRRDWYF